MTWNRVDVSSVYLRDLANMFHPGIFPFQALKYFQQTSLCKLAVGWRAADLGFVLLIPTQPYPNKSPRVKLFSNIKSDVTTGCPTQHKTTMAINVTALITFFNGPAPNKERNGNQILLQVLLHLSPLFSLLVFGSDKSSRSDV